MEKSKFDGKNASRQTLVISPFFFTIFTIGIEFFQNYIPIYSTFYYLAISIFLFNINYVVIHQIQTARNRVFDQQQVFQFQTLTIFHEVVKTWHDQIQQAQQLSNKMTEKTDIAINLPQITSPKYKTNRIEIEQYVRQLNSFTDGLQRKVGTMLKGQQTQFVNSYKDHICKVEQALKEYQNRLEQYQKKIEYYENEGVLATLLNKISFLQTQEKKLLSSLDRKNRAIIDLKNEINLQGKQITSLQDRIKELLKQGGTTRRTQIIQNKEPKESEQTFATEAPYLQRSFFKSNRSLEKIPSDQKPKNNTNREDINESNQQLKRVRVQVQSLRKKNRQLSSVNSKIIQRNGQVDSFFLKIVNELKRKISARKQFTTCSFEDFRQQDKLQLLVKILSNEDILKCLYERLFPKSQAIQQTTETRLPQILTARRQ